MKKQIIFSMILLIIILPVTNHFSQIKEDESMAGTMSQTPNESEWQKVKAFEEKGLYKSALIVVEEIFKRSKEVNDPAEMVKALLFKMRFRSEIEENELVRQIDLMESMISESQFPVRPLLQSILAEMVWFYYQNNRYAILDRTKTQGVESENIETWDASKFIDKISTLYNASLDAVASQKDLSLDIYDAILIMDKKGEYRKYRPTLYDFLAHRAVDFFMHQEPGLVKPASEFQLKKESVFLPAKAFVKETFFFEDSHSLKYQALKILMGLIEFHLKDDQVAAMIDVDLKRLSFVYANLVNEKKDALYIDALKRLEKKYRSHPESSLISYQLASFYNKRGGQYVFAERELYKEDRKKAHEICESAIARFPDSDAVQNLKALKQLILTKKLSIDFENVNTPEKPFRALVHFQNVDKIYVSAYPITPEEHKNVKNHLSGSRNYFDDLIATYRKRDKAISFEVDLPDPGDFQKHTTEIKIPPLYNGLYVILVGTSPEFDTLGHAVAAADVWVSDLSYIQKDTREGTPLFYVFDRESGKPVHNASLQIWVDEYDKKRRRYVESKGMVFQTNQDGEVKIPYLKKENSSNGQYHRFKVDLSYQGDRLFLDDFLRGWGYRGYNHEKPKKSSFFFTDRKLYRPGQRVYFKGIMLRMEKETHHILPNFQTKVELFDANHKVISAQNLITNNYGTFSGSFVLPEGSLTGSYYVQDSYGTVQFFVEEYKRPKFEVEFKPLKGSFRLNDTVKIRGKATAYAGSTIDQAKVHYRVVRSVTYPFWEYGWQFFVPPSQLTEISNGTLKTDDSGNFEIEFKALPDPLIPKAQLPQFSYEVMADVTDVGGETHSTKADVKIGYVALSVDLAVPESINRDEKVSLAITTKNLNEVFEPARGTITIYELAQPERIMKERLWERPDVFTISKDAYYKDFPFDIYDDEDQKERWKTKEKVLEYRFDTEKQKTFEPDMGAWQQGAYRVELETKDAYGTPVRKKKFVSLYAKKDPMLPGHNLLWHSALVNEGEPGETASFLWGSSAGDVYARLEVYHKNKIVESYTLTANNRKQMISLPIKERYRGNFSLSLMFVKYGRLNQFKEIVKVPWSNKKLKVTYETFRDKLRPGQEETWQLKISGPEKDRVAAEMVASLYDASLDAIEPHEWDFSIYPQYPVGGYYHEIINNHAFQKQQYQATGKDWNLPFEFKGHVYDRLNWFGYSPGGHGGYLSYATPMSASVLRSAEEDTDDGGTWASETTAMVGGAKAAMAPNPPDFMKGDSDNGKMISSDQGILKEISKDAIRKNLNETAFFYPHLKTNAEGEILINFTIPEALTRWKFMSFTHTKDLLYTIDKKEIVTQKEMMVTPHAPRFLREGDEMVFKGKISNLTDQVITGNAHLKLFDAFTMKPVDEKFKHAGTSVPFEVKPKQSTAVSWKIHVSDDVGAVAYRVVAETERFSDGEESILPILKNRMLVTHTLPMTVRGKGRKTFKLDKLAASKRMKTLKHHRLTLEFTSNPTFLALQSLPYLMEQPHASSEYLFNKVYANRIAGHLIHSNPNNKALFDSWSLKGQLVSNLEKNQELKSLMLQETPWVRDAETESERKKRLSLLFDLNTIKNEGSLNLKKLKQLQLENGAFPWFPGMGENPFITQYIVAGFGRLMHLGILKGDDDPILKEMISEALLYLDEKMAKDYELIKKDQPDEQMSAISSLQVHYLYTRSFFMDHPVKKEHIRAFEFIKSQTQTFWKNFSLYTQGLIGISLHRLSDEKLPPMIVASLKERSLHSKELGMYWKNNKKSYFWHKAPIETQSLLIELFDEVADDMDSVNEMRIWLLKQKQVSHWESTKATADACYALILKGSNWLKNNSLAEISVGGETISPEKEDAITVEAGTGYFKKAWGGKEIDSSMSRVRIKKTDDGIGWGALYWQYFEDLDNITPHESPLSIKRNLFLQKDGKRGPIIEPITRETKLAPGDLVKVRIQVRVDRDMEYVHMKDLRASSLEPVDVISQTKYQGDLYYYESIRDAATHFFFEQLPKGTHLFEFDLRITHEGDFSSGLTTIQSLYAPEFAAHSRGGRLVIR